MYRVLLIALLAGCTTQESCEADGGTWALVANIHTNHCYDHKRRKEIISYTSYCDVRQVYGCLAGQRVEL